MAIFASTTTSGYSDPLKAMSIKALEQRLKDQQAQMAQQQPDAAMMATIPGGIGHVLGVVGDRMNQSRTETAAAAQKDELAKLIAADPNGENPQTQARMAVLAPDMYKDVVQHIAERRRQAAEHAHATSLQQGTQTFQRGENELNRGETRATRAQQGEQFAATQDLTKSESALTRQNARDLATQAQRAHADLAQAERDVKVAENALDRASKSGDQQAMITAQSALEDKKAGHAEALANVNNAARATEGREERTFRGSESALERAQREQLAKSEQTFKSGESAEDRALRERLQVGQQAFTGTENAADRAQRESLQKIAQSFQAGESVEERALRERLQSGQQNFQGTENAANRAATKENQAAQIASHEKIAAAEAGAKAAALASDPKRQGEVATLGEKYARQHQAVTKLDKAVDILNNGGINTGPWARAETVAANIANGRFGTDKEMAQRTTAFNSLINEAAINQMSETLKGQTTNFEMDKFLEIMNNPLSGPEDRIAAITRLRDAAKVGRDLSANAFKQSGGNIDIVHQHLGGGAAGGTGGGGDAASKLREAQDAINQGAKFDEVVALAQKAGLSTTGLKQKGM